MSTTESGIPIRENELIPFTDEATRLISKTSWRSVLSEADRRSALQLGWDDGSIPRSSADSVSIHNTGLLLSNDALLLEPKVNIVLDVLRDGVAFGDYIENQMGTLIGIEHLNHLNRKSSISPMQQSERVEKNRTLATVRLFAMSYYIMWHLHDFHSDELVNVDVKFPGLAEVELSEGYGATKCALYYFGKFMADSGMVNTPLELIQFTKVYFGAILEHLHDVRESLKYTEKFTKRTYILDGSDFFIKGFEENYGEGSVEEVVTEEVHWGDVIGNVHAKRILPQAINRAFLQDQATSENPIERFGGFPRITIMHGYPGNGKTHTMFAVMTHARHIANVTGRKIKIVMWPRNLKNKYQGVQEERNAKLGKSLSDSQYLYFIFVDEAEVVAPDREKEGISTGDHTSTNFMLDITKGSLKKPFHFWFLATNHYHMIDSAMRDRADVTVEMTGAETENDMIDFMHMVLSKQDETFDEALHLEWPDDYEHFADQENLLREKVVDDSPVIEGLDNMFEEAGKSYPVKSYRYWGRVLYSFLKAYPEFSLRKVGTILESALFDLTTINIDEDFLAPDGPYQEAEDLEAKETILRQLVEEHLAHSDVSFTEVLERSARQVLEETAKAEDVKFEREVEKGLFYRRVDREIRRRMSE